MAKRVNWDFIKPLWRAGGLSNCEIARQYKALHKDSKEWKQSVDESAIRKTAKNKKWQRDLAEKVKKRTEEKLVRRQVRADNAIEDDEIVEAAAETRAQVVELQRRDLKELKELEADIIRRLKEDEVQILVGWYEGSANEHQVQMGFLERVRAYRELVVARTKRISTEREAWGLKDKSKDGESKDVKVEMYLGGDKNE
jgi:hypothetical protein